MRDVPRKLRRALRAGAANGRAVFVALHGRAADRAEFRQMIGLRLCRALFLHHGENFRNDLARLADADGIADADVLLGDKVLIVQRGVRDRRSGQTHGADHRLRRQHAGPSDLDDDVLDHRFLDLRRVFIGTGPAREFRRAAEHRPVGKRVQLHDRAVDVKGIVIASLPDPANFLDRLRSGGTKLVRNDLKVPLRQIVQSLRMRLKGHTLCQLQIENQDVQPPSRRNGRVELAQAARSGIARIGKQGLALLLALGVQGFKHRARHKYLAAHDQPCRRIFNPHGNGTDGFEVFRYILTDLTVSARCAADELAVPVFQRDG